MTDTKQMEALFTNIIDNKKFEVFFDEDGFYHDFHSDFGIEFDSEFEKEKYMKRFINGELNHYGVVQSLLCECCQTYKEVNSMWGIHAIDDAEAYNIYIKEYLTFELGLNILKS